MLLADSAARARELLGQGAHALVVAAKLPDSQGAALTVALRGEAATAELPIFVLAPPEDPDDPTDPANVDCGSDAYLDDEGLDDHRRVMVSDVFVASAVS